MALANIYRVVQDLEGNVVTGVLGTVTLSGTSTLAALFADADGTLPLPNPTTNNAQYGSFSLFVDAGTYDLQFVKAGFTFETQQNITLRDPAAGVNSITGTANRVLVSPVPGVGAVTLSTPQDIAPDSSVQFAHIGVGTPATSAPIAYADQAAARTALGLGTMATQNAVSVAVTGGSITGITDLAIADGGTGASTAATARTNLGLGTLSTQNANAVAITGGAATFDGNVIAAGPVRVPERAGTLAAFEGLLSAGASRYNLWMQGTAQNFLNGTVGCGGLPGAGMQVLIAYPKASRYGLQIQSTDVDPPGSANIRFVNVGGGEVGSITTSATITAYNTTSDVRLKFAIATLAGALDVVAALRPVTFRWNADDSVGHGFLAHELQQVVPEAVTGEPDAVDAQGNVVPQGVDHSRLVPWLTAALQEVVAQVQALSARVQSVEEQLGI